MKEQSIELDCPPGYPRPGDLIEDVVAGLNLGPVPDTCSRFFGCWKWMFQHIPEEQWKAAQPTLKERIKKLYDSGVIRYGSW